MIINIAVLIVISILPQSQWVVFTSIAVLGVTYNGLILTTINGLGVLLSPEEAPAALPGLNGSAFGIGASLGIGIIAPYVAQGTISGYSTALWVSVCIAVLAFIASLFIAPRQGQKL